MKKLFLGTLALGLSTNVLFAETQKNSFLEDLNFSGFLDVFYGFNVNRPPSVASPAAHPPAGNTGAGLRFYDHYHNQFGLSLLQLSAAKETGEVQFHLSLDFGTTADINATGSDPTGTAVIDETSKHLSEANVTYAPSALNGWSITVGKILTPIGYEAYSSKTDWQYSRSIICSLLPTWHLGMAIQFPTASEKVDGTFYVFNGWNNFYDNNDGKTLGLQLRFNFSDSFVFTYNFLGGPERAEDNGNWRILNEANFVWSVTDILAIALEGLSGYEVGGLGADKNAQWFGTTAHAKWDLLNWYSISPRFEYFYDTDGFAVNGYIADPTKKNKFVSVTVTQAFQAAKGLEFKLEGRYDRAMDTPIYTKHSGLLSNQEFTVAAAALYSF